jgi:hypothetical protein
MNGLTAFLYSLIYCPSNFRLKSSGVSKWELIQYFDYVGTLLHLAGLLFHVPIFLLLEDSDMH